jgi:RISC-loading complex subunit TARBP2
MAADGSCKDCVIGIEECTIQNVCSNPIGALQELCISKNLPAPSYEVESEDGPPHARNFTIGCRVLTYHVVAKGHSKQFAKYQAATEMYPILQALHVDQPQEDSVAILQKTAVEHRFNVTYNYVESPGRPQCLVQLTPLIAPVVCQGSGKTKDRAKTAAAKIALEYLKLAETSTIPLSGEAMV